MAIYKEDIVTINLEAGNIFRSFMKHTIGMADSAADRFGIRVMRGDEEVDLTGCSCYGYFRDPHGNNIALTSNGTVNGAVAYVTLPQACYNYEGQFTLAIKLIGGGVTGTMRIVDGVIDNTNTGSAVAPTGTVPTYTEILSVYDDMVECVQDYDDVVDGQDQKISAMVERTEKSIKHLTFTDGAPSGDYGIAYPAFVQGGATTSGTTITYTESTKDIHLQNPISGGHLVHNLDTTNCNVRVYIFINGSYSGRAMREGSSWSATIPDEWVYLPAVDGYTYMVVYHSTGDAITPSNNMIEILQLDQSDYPIGKVIPGYAWDSTYGMSANTKRAIMFLPEVRNGDVIKFDGNRYSVNYYILGGNMTDLIYTPNAWNTTGSLAVSVPTDKPYQICIQFKWSDNDVVQPERAAYIFDHTFLQDNHIKTVDLFMFMGQSNMAGRGVTNSTWTERAPKIGYGAGYEFKAISDPTQLYPAAEPFGVDENLLDAIDDTTPDNDDLTTGVSKKTGSCVVALMNTYFGITGVPIVGVSASEGGTPISLWQPNTAKLNDAINRLQTCVAWLEAHNYYIRHKYMMWCQGENDASTPSADYKTAFAAMFGAMQAAGIEKCFLARIGEYNNNGSSAYSAMIQCQTEITQETADVIMATTTLASFRDRGLMKDKYHFYQAGYNEMGRYSGANIAVYVETGKEVTMYDPKYTNLYYSHKN